jgi:uncharacterized protein (TIGR02453 family)
MLVDESSRGSEEDRVTDQRNGKPVTAFDGFGSGMTAFFEQLSANNSREWFKRHKDEYDNEIAGPLQSLGDALEPEFGSIKIYRPYRDLRFSADKRPIQEHASLSASDARGYGYYLQVSADGLVVAGGLYQPDRDRLNRFRTMLDSKPEATKIKRQLTAAKRHDLELSDTGKLKSAPKDFSKDHPEIHLLRYTQLALTKTYEPAPWIAQAICHDHVREDWLHVKTWIDFLANQGI